MRRFLHALGDLLLTALAVLGTLCILATVAALIGGVSLILFSTGSMSPTIPAGSVALVRPIPAAEVRVGDIVTVERDGRLPVTHRVRRVDPSGGHLRVLTLRGDANESDDTETYRVSSVRLVVFSVPGAATVVASMGRPNVLGGITVAATVLVLWAFWPRRGGPRSGDGRARRPAGRARRPAWRARRPVGQARRGVGRARRGAAGPVGPPVRASANPPRRARPELGRATPAARRAAAAPRRVVAMLILAVLLGLVWTVPSAPPAQAKVDERVIRGRVITLVSVGDHESMAHLTPGRPVAWQVGVMSDPLEAGQIDVSLRTAGLPTSDGILLRVDGCNERWRDDACASGAHPVLVAGPASRFLAEPVDLGRLATGSQRWLLVTAWLPADRPDPVDVGARVTVTASGFGDRISDDPGELPQTGSNAGRGLLVAALVATLAGIAIVLRRSRT